MSRRKKTIDVFNISFLDLLSGALGAVIILFIVVPKSETPVITQEKDERVCIDNSTALEKCQSLSEQKSVIIKELTKNLEAKIVAPVAQEEPVVKEEKVSSSSSNDVGFNFKGKRVAFLIDTSGSMAKSDRIGQVKAGLKMLIASMGKDYYVDIIYFPHTPTSSYYSLWGVLQDLRNLDIKEEIYEFLARLQPQGTTPTRSALSYVLTHYKDLSDIVLLSDGAPTKTGRTSQADDIDDLVKEISKMNETKKVQINAIGVGATQFKKSSKLYEFLENLTKENDGFFYGF